jgi:uncharacterized protein (TIGR03437 family)
MRIMKDMTKIKLALVSLFITITVLTTLNVWQVGASSSQPLVSLTGAPSEQTCVSCHRGYNVNEGAGRLELLGLPDKFVPGQEYTLTVSFIDVQRDRRTYGFQLTALNQDGQKWGEIIVTEASRTQLLNGNVGGDVRQYLEHTANSVAPTFPGRNTWSFKWKAPRSMTSAVTFYMTGVAGDGSRSTMGDYVYSKLVAISPEAVPFTSVSAAGYGAIEGVSPDSIVAGFGRCLATHFEGASEDTNPEMEGFQLPLSLAGTTVTVKDSAGIERPAPLFYVSAEQINYLMPAETALGDAEVTVTAGDGSTSTGTVKVGRIAPSLFSADQSGTGIAAALLIRVKPDDTQIVEPLYRLTETGAIEPIPVEMGPATDRLFLILYGTGIRRRASMAAVSALIGELNGVVTYAGEVPGAIGLDQINVMLQRSNSLRGQEPEILMNVEGTRTNPVKIMFRP